MNNLPKVKIGIVAVSRDCFPASLAINRRKALMEAYKAKYDAADIYECPVCIIERRDRPVCGFRAYDYVRNTGKAG